MKDKVNLSDILEFHSCQSNGNSGPGIGVGSDGTGSIYGGDSEKASGSIVKAILM